LVPMAATATCFSKHIEFAMIARDLSNDIRKTKQHSERLRLEARVLLEQSKSLCEASRKLLANLNRAQG
jgi:hypothetical protein